MSQTEIVDNSMRRIAISKVVINIGVGKSGEAVERARKVLDQITGQKPAERKAKESIRDFGIAPRRAHRASRHGTGETAPKS